MRVIAFNKAFEENGYLNIDYKCVFFVDGYKFTSVRQYVNYYRAFLFKDEYRLKKILESTDTREMEDLGRSVSNFDNKIWNGIRQIVMYKANYYKFSQNEELKQQLLATGDAPIAECSKFDKVWGIGFHPDDTRIFKPSNWQGTNLLGYALMEVRSTLRSESVI